MKTVNKLYNVTEMMVIAGSRLFENGKCVVVGTGLPVLSTLLAQSTHAPQLVLIYEAGSLAPLKPPTIPISVGDSMASYKAIMTASMDYTMSFIQSGFGEYGFLGAAQIDPFGNINTTVIGSHKNPKVRLPGSGGANDFASLCWKTIIMMRQDKKKFVKKLDYITSPGYLEGYNSREKIGLPSNTGPWRVVTQFGIFGFENEEKKMTLIKMYPGVTINTVQENSSFKIQTIDDVQIESEPTNKELILLRALDPYGILLKK